MASRASSHEDAWTTRARRFGSVPGALLSSFALVSTSITCVTLAVVVLTMVVLAAPALRTLGWTHFAHATWDPARGELGILTFVFGTFVSASVALLLSVPVALGVALFLSDLGPRRLRRPVAALVDMLVAVPSVVYGLWAALVLAPVLRTTVEPLLEATLGFLPFFRGPHIGVGMLCASVVLAVMILPTIASVAREVLLAVPDELREGGLALGATPWEIVRRVVLTHAWRGLVGAVVMGFGRAASESLAVAMVLGGRAELSLSLFEPGSTLGSVLVNEFAEAGGPLHLAALAEIGLLLLVVTITVHVLARSWVKSAFVTRAP